MNLFYLMICILIYNRCLVNEYSFYNISKKLLIYVNNTHNLLVSRLSKYDRLHNRIFVTDTINRRVIL